MTRTLILPILLASAPVWADTPLRSLVYYTTEAKRDQPGFVADSERGRSFALRNWGVSPSLASCAACHGEHPQAGGRHAVTGEPLPALSPVLTPKRFSNPAQVEKRFRRDCSDVLGRLCTAEEKADFIRFVMGERAS